MSDLLPCPFCGVPIIAESPGVWRHPSLPGLPCVLRNFAFRDRQIKQWNTRTPAPPADGGDT